MWKFSKYHIMVQTLSLASGVGLHQKVEVEQSLSRVLSKFCIFSVCYGMCVVLMTWKQNYLTVGTMFQTCIDGLVHRKNAQLCGRRRYNPRRHLCCNGRLNPKGHGLKCCGFYVYNPNYNTCCYGHTQPGAESRHRYV